MTDECGRVWSIVLAGGEGERMRAFAERWLGCHVPKQYCTFVGTRSMFQHTMDRVAEISAPEHTLAVIARPHRPIALGQLAGRSSVGVIAQPVNRDTASGILLGLTYVRRQDPNAMVAIFPSDHFVSPEHRFLRAVRSAIRAAAHLEDRLVLVGVAPDSLELDYGWITPGQDVGWSGEHRVRTVHSFVEKPAREEAMRIREAGGLWNTMVVAGRASTFWALGRKHVPIVMPHFDHLCEALGTPRYAQVLESIYAVLPRLNFSADLLEKASTAVAVLSSGAFSGATGADLNGSRRPSSTSAKRPRFHPCSMRPADRAGRQGSPR